MKPSTGNVRPELQARTYIDPDFRGKIPSPGTAYCCQCQKPLNLAKQKYVRGTVNWEEPNDEGRIWEFKVDPNGEDLLGPDCAKQIGLTAVPVATLSGAQAPNLIKPTDAHPEIFNAEKAAEYLDALHHAHDVMLAHGVDDEPFHTGKPKLDIENHINALVAHLKAPAPTQRSGEVEGAAEANHEIDFLIRKGFGRQTKIISDYIVNLEDALEGSVPSRSVVDVQKFIDEWTPKIACWDIKNPLGYSNYVKSVREMVASLAAQPKGTPATEGADNGR